MVFDASRWIPQKADSSPSAKGADRARNDTVFFIWEGRPRKDGVRSVEQTGPEKETRRHSGRWGVEREADTEIFMLVGGSCA